MLSFIRNLVGVKADNAMQAGVEALVRWDPQSASEAELRTTEQHLDDLGLQVAGARQSYDKEQKEAEAIQALSQQRMAAAEQLQRQIAAEPDATRKAGLEQSLGTLVTMLEQMAPEIEREKRMPSTPRISSRRSRRPTRKLAASRGRAGPNWSVRGATWRARGNSARWLNGRPKRRAARRG